MTKFSKVLTIAVTVLCVAFMAVAAAMTATYTDWKARAAEYPSSKLADQKKLITDLDAESTALDTAIKHARDTQVTDVDAMTDPAVGRLVQWEAELVKLEAQAKQLADQIEEEAKKVLAKLDELKLRREEVVRLRAQYDELIAQRQSAELQVRRIRDLLFQARGQLERVKHRKDLLEADGAKAEYDATPAATDKKST